MDRRLNPKKTGPPPLDISRDYSATRKALAATLYDLFLSSFPRILTPNLWCPGVRFWSYVTFCTCTSDRKWLQNVILCTKSMQIEFFHIVHINMLIFTLNGWNEFVLAKSVCHKFHREKHAFPIQIDPFCKFSIWTSPQIYSACMRPSETTRTNKASVERQINRLSRDSKLDG